MGARYRLWIAAGVAVVAVLAAATWFLAVSPQQTEAADLRSDTETARTQADDLRARIVKLTADKASLSVLTSALNARKQALPADSGVPAFLRRLQATGTRYGVDVTGVTVSDPSPVESVPDVWALPIQLTAEGPADGLGAFLTQMQGSKQERAVLIEAVNLTSDSEGVTGGAQALVLNLTVKAFVAPPAGGGAPSITTD